MSSHQIQKGLRVLPSPRHILELLLLSLGFGAIAYILMPDLINLDAIPSPGKLAVMALLTFIIPAFTEELVFRGLLTPSFKMRWAIASTLLFVLWHPFEAYTFLPDAKPLFTHPTFLVIVTLLGMLCWFAYRRTGSLWASVLVHWWVVVSWKSLGGAGFIA